MMDEVLALCICILLICDILYNLVCLICSYLAGNTLFEVKPDAFFNIDGCKDM